MRVVTVMMIITYGLLSICLGIVPALILFIVKYGKEGKNWLACVLGGGFWLVALLLRLYPLNFLSTTLWNSLIIGPLLAGLFETIFRAILIWVMGRFMHLSMHEIIAAGLGWGMLEALLMHTIPVFISVIYPGDSEVISQLQSTRLEWTLIFGGIERIIAESFHVSAMILVAYGVPSKNVESPEPKVKGFYTRDPHPKEVWVLIVAGIHFLFDFSLITLYYTVGILWAYMFATMIVGVLYSYLSNRIDRYPLYPS